MKNNILSKLSTQIETHSFAVISIIFATFYLWRPFFLGFYADDWNYFIDSIGSVINLPFYSAEKINVFIDQFANRPVMGALYYIFTLFAGQSIFGWQIVSLIIVFANTAALFYFLKYLFILLNVDKSNAWALLGTLLWLFSPWSLAVTAWPIGVICLPAMTFFLIGGYFLFKSLSTGKKTYFLPVLFYALSCLNYESYYFQFIFLIAIFFIAGLRKQFGIKYPIKLFALYSTVQVFAVVWNRFVYLFAHTQSVNKPFNPLWLETYAANVISFPYALTASFGIFIPLMIILSAILIVLTLKQLLNKSDNEFNRGKLLSILILIAICIFVALFTYSLAGYTIWGMGARSRTTMSNGFFAILAFLITIIFIEKKFNNFKLKSAFISLLLISFVGANVLRTYDWIKAWDLQKEVIFNLPSEKILKTANDAIIITDIPFLYNWAPVFSTEWSIDIQLNMGKSAIQNNKPIAKFFGNRKFIMGRNLIHSYYNAPWINIWDGKILRQQYELQSDASKPLTGSIFNRYLETAGSELWLWRSETGEFLKIDQPDTLKFEQIRNYDYWITSLWTNHIKKMLGK